MYQVIIVVHVLLGLGVIGLVLMQQGKGADAGAAFGTGSSGTVFGAQGAASFLSRSTAILATLFFATSLGLAILSGNQGSNVYDFMSTPEAVEKDALDIPDVGGTQNTDNVPSIPAVKPQTATTPTEIKATEDNIKPEAQAPKDNKNTAKDPVTK